MTSQVVTNGVEPVSLDAIVFDADTQIRAAISECVVSDYAERMAEGVEFPPVVLFHDGSRSYMADGFHRGLAAKRNGTTDISATVKAGTRTDALWHALGANRANGHRLTPADKKHAIELALRTWPDKSERELATQVGCSKTYVHKLRGQVVTSDHVPTRVTGKDGKSYPARRPVPHDRPTPDDARAWPTTAVRVQGLDPTNIIERTILAADVEAASYESDMYLIDFGSVNRERIVACVGALRNQRRALSAVIRRLELAAGLTPGTRQHADGVLKIVRG